MIMKKLLFVFVASMLVAGLACEGPRGPAGDPGATGDKGDKGDTGNPGAPANPSAVVLTVPRYDTATGSALITWTINVDGNFTQYKLYRSSTPGVTEGSTLLATITDRYSTTYEDVFGSKPTNYYYYRVYAYNASGATPSNEVMLTGLHILKFSFGTSGTGNGQFTYPGDVAVDSNGNIYVADSDNNRIQKFDSNGNYLTQWGTSGTGDGQFNEPYNIEYGPDGYLYVGDWGNNRIQIFDTAGNFINKFSTTGGPGDSFIAENGDIYVPDYSNNYVRWFDSAFTPLLTWGGTGSGNGQFSLPWDIAASPDGRKLYVLDNGNLRVQVFTNTGAYLSQFPGSGTGSGLLNEPWGLGVDNNGYVYVTDWSEGMVQIYDEDGGFIEEFVIPGSSWGIWGLDFDKDNNLYVVDANNAIVHVFGP